MATKITQEILNYRSQGLGYKRISALTGYSINTVKSVCRRNPEALEKRCLQCGAVLVQLPHRKKKKFCSDKCRMAWWNSHPELVNRKAVYRLTCQNCGREFESYGNAARKYCSRACYGKSRAKAVEE